jgi:flagellar basal-body rod protein FlgC
MIMALLNTFTIAGSGLSVQSLRLNVTASNLANAESVSSSTQGTYRARHPVFATLLDDLQGAEGASGVRVLGVVESQAPLPMEYQPTHPLANAQGYIYLPNVNPIEEMANMISASRSYETNVEVINTTKQLLLKTLTLGQ